MNDMIEVLDFTATEENRDLVPPLVSSFHDKIKY